MRPMTKTSKRARFVVEETKGFSRTRVFLVRRPEQQAWESINVWVSENGRAQCVSCSGPLQAMLSSCPHAKAVARKIAVDSYRAKG